MNNINGYKFNSTWWTLERVLLGLKRFYKDFSFAPTSTEAYQEKQQFTGRIVNGRSSSRGYDNKYPSSYAVLKFFTSFREAWRACDIPVNKSCEAWSAIEDWFIIESVGILPRKEVAQYLDRSVPAVKRRLYDLGQINSFTRWGTLIIKGVENAKYFSISHKTIYESWKSSIF